jgi:transcription initiation factor IIF auxiliary subunit
MSAFRDPKSRVAILDTIFWEVLPAHYEKIQTRWEKIAHLYAAAKHDQLTTDRDGAINSLKAELDILEVDVQEYWNVAKGINVTDIAGIYVVAGDSKDEALKNAKEHLDDLHLSLQMVKDKIHETRAEIRYGFEKEEGQ